MAYTTINKSGDYFNTKLYSGNATARSITGVGFQPDFTWIKNRSYTHNHVLSDAVRGSNKGLNSDTTNAEVTDSSNGYVTGFVSDGFSISNSDYGWVNNSSSNYASWNWKAGTTGSGNTGGSGTYKTYNYSVNTTAGFSIIKYTGNATSGHTIPHHLGAVPSMVIVKRLENTRHWCVGHASEGWTKAAFLSSTDSWDSAYDYWNNANPTSTSIALSNSVAVNSNNETYIMYIFAEKTGYSKIGQYIGNGNADGTFVYTGFKPKWFLLKKSSASGTNWELLDSTRPTGNPNDKRLRANTSEVEATSTRADFLSNGIKIRTSGGETNTSLESYAYIAFGQSLVGSNNVPCTAR